MLYDVEQIERSVNTCVQIIESLQSKRAIFNDVDGEKIYLNINTVKIPDCSQRIVRLILEHSFLNKNCEICLFVNDKKFGKSYNSEKTIEYYEKMFRNCKFDIPIKTIITSHQLKTQYDKFEVKQRLCNQFDLFLVDALISKDVSILLTTLFVKKHKAPVPIALNRRYETIENQVNNALKKTSFRISNCNNHIVFQIASSVMNSKNIIDNVCSVFDQMNDMCPGGWNNVRSIFLFCLNDFKIPLYYSFKRKNEVEVPKIESKSKFCEVVSDELSTFNDVKVDVHPNGFVQVHRLKSENEVLI